jgi:DNA-binding winged helix-turn-helix (wHTH) protein
MRAFAMVKQDPPHRDQRAVLSFPPFRLDVAEERLWKEGRELHLRPKPFAILRYLTEHPRRLVTQSEIVDAVWGKIAMSESVLRTHMHNLRHVLGKDVIETVVGRGYRFLADVSEIDDARNGKGLAGKGPLELVRTSESPSPGQAGEVAQAVRPVDIARILKELSDALATLGMKATVLLLVGDEQSERLAEPAGDDGERPSVPPGGLTAQNPAGDRPLREAEPSGALRLLVAALAS